MANFKTIYTTYGLLRMAEAGEDASMKIVTEGSYYNLPINGEDGGEIPFLGMVEHVNGTDSMRGLHSKSMSRGGWNRMRCTE